MYAMYTAAFAAAVTGYAPLALARRVTRGMPLNLRERLGLGRHEPPAVPCGWIHAVSVGEAIAAAPLVEGLRRTWPALPLVVSTVTETGARVVRERFAGLARHRYFPLDFPGSARRVIASLEPAFFIGMETELWPNLRRALAARGVPTMIANSRLSDRSFRRYRLVRGAMRRVLSHVTVFGMQSDEDARRMIALGAPAAAPTIIVLDTVGELAQLYSIADVVFVGGSLIPLGGHNMLEPALRAKPVLFGPHTSNFRDAAALLLTSGGGQVVRDAGELATELRRLLDDPQRRAPLGAAARDAAASRHGPSRATLELVARYLHPDGPA